MLPLVPYPSGCAGEIDLRFELNEWFTGSGLESPKGQLVIVRRMRRDDSVVGVPRVESDLTACSCVTAANKEPDITYTCAVCGGEGYLWDEEFAIAYKEEEYEYIDRERRRPYGKGTISMSFFYIEFYKDLSRFDKIIEPQIDEDGNVESPVRVYRYHNIHMAQKLKSDHGRVEYWRCGCFSEPYTGAT